MSSAKPRRVGAWVSFPVGLCKASGKEGPVLIFKGFSVDGPSLGALEAGSLSPVQGLLFWLKRGGFFLLWGPGREPDCKPFFFF